MTDAELKNTSSTNVLIIGSGLAGLLLALQLSESGASVILASKQSLLDSNTSMAQGGLAAVSGSNMLDNPLLHLQDTIKAGAGLTDELVAKVVIDYAPKLINLLEQYRVRFDTSDGGRFSLAREGGHSQARVLHHRDTTGKTISTALIDSLFEKARMSEKIDIRERTEAKELLVHDGRCIGASFYADGKILNVFAEHTVLATGGVGQVFGRTTNPTIATGDGIALAYRAGARLVDMEMMQFHPTALYKEGVPAFLISEAVRGAGAQLIDAAENKFARRFHPDAELATRDVIARGIHTIMEEQKSSCVFLDLRPMGAKKLRVEFPNILHTCAQFGIDALNEPVPVAPAAHYFMGGIWTDIDCETTVEGLYAIGECASTGLHGANRLASNSLLEAGVSAIRLADMIKPISNTVSINTKRKISAASEMIPVPSNIDELRMAMYRFCGLVRSDEGLSDLLGILDRDQQQHISKTYSIMSANMLTVGKLIANAALIRRESRGAHYRKDYPTLDDLNFQKRLAISQENGWHWLEVNRLSADIDKRAARTA